LYVGKAKSLKQRVGSYFQPHRKHPEHILEMLTQAQDIKFHPTASALEAALSEWDEIDRLSPPYNIALRKTGRDWIPWTTDLRPEVPGDSKEDRLGFFPRGNILKGVRLIGIHARRPFARHSPPHREDIARMVGTLSDMAPSANGLGEGLAWLNHHFPQLGQHPGIGGYLALGAAWECHLLRQKVPTDGVTEEDGAEIATMGGALVPQWSPQTVGQALARQVARGARLIRRAHWFTLLSESCLAWRLADSDSNEYRLIMVDQGRVHLARTSDSLAGLSPPRNSDRCRRDRLARLSAVNITRLRLLTTEIKRLVAEKRPMILGLGPRRSFERTSLSRIVPWL
jgi:hypothetical protein